MNKARRRGDRNRAPSAHRPHTQFEAAAKAAGLAPATGKSAIDGPSRASIDAKRLTGSIDMDKAFANSEPNSARWDYGVGIAIDDNEAAFWIEPHPASSTSEVTAMLAKLAWLRRKLDKAEFADLRRLTDAAGRIGIAFRWLTSSSIRLRPGSSDAMRLAKDGLAFPTRHLRLP